MEYIKTFNKEEKEIYDICCSDNVDYDKIEYLLKNGADANAVEITKYDNADKNEEELLLVQCWLDGQFNRRCDEDGNKIETDPDFCIKLLKLFIDNGLNVDKYVNHIFRDIQFTYDDKNYIEMTKLILNNLKDKNSLILEESLEGIGWEESYNNCCEVDHRYANVLATMYEMIEKYPEGNDPNKYFSCDKIIGQKIEDVQIKENSSIKSDLGDVKIDKINDIYVDAETDLGEVEVENNNRKSEIILEIECDCGDIKISE